MYDCFEYPQFLPGTKVISLVSHAPEIGSGDLMNIVKPWYGNLCAVQLPDGMIHRWFASFELRPDDHNYRLAPGRYATVISSEGHGNPPHIAAGTKVKIVRCIQAVFFDAILSNGQYHRWIAEFELAKPV